MEYPPKEGRPCSLTDELKATLLEAVSKLYSLDQIAYRCNIDPSTLRRWLRDGRKDHLENNNSIFDQFYLEFFKRRAEAAEQLIKTMLEDKDNFKQNTWLLERTYRKDFGQRVDEQRHFYNVIAAKLAKAGVKMDDFDDFMTQVEIEGE